MLANITMHTESLGSMIARLRDRLGMTQTELAKAASVPREWLSVVELDRIKRPDRERLERIATALEVPAATVLAAAGFRVAPMPIREQRTPYEIARELEVALRQSPILIPEAEGVVSAGPGAPAEAERWPYYPTPAERGHQFTVVRVVGSCMEPRIHEGERVIVDMTESPRPGNIVAARRDGEHLVKLLEKRNGDLWLVALQDQPPIRVDGGVTILGVVKMISRRP